MTDLVQRFSGDRRRFLQAGLAGIGLGVSGGLLVGCSTDDSPAGGSSSDTGEVEVLRIGVAANPSSLDPTKNVGNVTIRVFYNVFETLLLADEINDYTIEPMLATEWTRIDDRTIDLTIAEGITFHDGSPLTAEDVKFSYERLVNDGIEGTETAAAVLTTLESVEVTGDLTVRVTAKMTDPILEQRIASSWGSWVLPKKYYEEVGQEGFEKEPIGTGPYKLEAFTPEKVTLVRYDQYWGELPAAKKIEYVLYAETSARITALLTGEVDLITQVPLDQVSAIESSSDHSTVGLPLANMHVLTYNSESMDPKLRQAMGLAIDRQLIIDTLWQGKAVLPRGHQYPEYGEMYLDDYPEAPYDPDRAKELVAESTYAGEELSYELTPGYYTLSSEAAPVLVEMWQKIGVNVKIKFTDNVERVNIAAWSNTMRFPDPLGGLWLLWGDGSSADQWWTDRSEEFSSIGEKLIASTDLAERRDLERRLMDLFQEEAPGTVLFYPYESWGVSNAITWRPYSSQTMDFRTGNFSVAR